MKEVLLMRTLTRSFKALFSICWRAVLCVIVLCALTALVPTVAVAAGDGAAVVECAECYAVMAALPGAPLHTTNTLYYDDATFSKWREAGSDTVLQVTVATRLRTAATISSKEGVHSELLLFAPPLGHTPLLRRLCVQKE